MCAGTSARSSSMSRATRTKLSATASRSCSTANARSARSFSVSDGAETCTPGRFMPLLLLSMPPCSTRQRTVRPSTATTATSIRPSLIRMRLPGVTSSASIGYVTGTCPSTASSSGASTSSSPSSSSCGADSTPMRMRGPCRSPRIATARPSSADTRRTSAMTRACCSCVPCEKLMRATSSPDWIRSRIFSGVLLAGPSVHTILVRGKSRRPAAEMWVPVSVIERLACSGPVRGMLMTSSLMPSLPSP